MYIKKSILDAEKEAKELSIKNPYTTYYVLDKRNKKAICLSVNFLIRDKILEGYYGICGYKNGIRQLFYIRF